jgi:rare lipoprotein A
MPYINESAREAIREHLTRLVLELSVCFSLAVCALTLSVRHGSMTNSAPPMRAASDPAARGMDVSAREQIGVASFYSSTFFGRTMADGNPMNPHGNNAASRTLPLGTLATVTNIDTGRSAVIRIEDRGPYVDGRIIDLSPATARKIGITARQGVAKVVVSPILVPLPNGDVRLGTTAVRRQESLTLTSML